MQVPEFRSPTRILYGPGALRRLPGLCRDLGGSRILVVSDRGIVEAGFFDRARDLLSAEDFAVSLFDQFTENPNSRMAELGARFAREHGADLIVGLGGGSSLDCAKAGNFLLTNGGRMEDYKGYGKAAKPMLPMIAVPTTAGTGSEVQSYALILDEHNCKMACGDPKAAFRAAILDPTLTISQPRFVTAAAGYDAIGHAVETYVTTRKTELSQSFSIEAWRLLDRNYPAVLEQPGHLEARAAMQLGACYAGIAIENSMLGATHALANPLTELYGTTHGVAIAVLLHHVVRWNAGVVAQQYEELVHLGGGEAGALADRLRSLLEMSGLPRTLRDAGAGRSDLPMLAEKALQQWTGTFNPRPLTLDAVLALYEDAF
jgi:alcohol dehydrogenase